MLVPGAVELLVQSWEPVELVCDLFYFAGIWSNFICRDDMSQVMDLLFKEIACNCFANRASKIFKWTVKCENAFAELKLSLCSSPFYHSHTFHCLHIGHSCLPCSVVLELYYHEFTSMVAIELVIAFTSRAMSKSEWKYSAP